MLKVLIADDEEKICQLIEKLIDWNALGMKLSGVANNGIEALEKIEALSPDVVITDIRMPGYDGLDLVKKTRELDLNVEFVIISGYRHFEYAQTAIKYGVSDYLLKPIKKQELAETLEKIKAGYNERNEQLTYEERVRLARKSDAERLRTIWFSNVLYREKREEDCMVLEEINKQYYYQLNPGCFQIVCVKFDGVSTPDEKNLEFLTEKTTQIAEQMLKGQVFDWELYVENSHIYIFLNYEEEKKKIIRRQCKNILNELAVLESILEGLRVTIGFGMPVNDPEQLKLSLKSARHLVEQRLVAGNGKLLEGDLRSSFHLASSQWFTQFNQDMNAALESLDRQQVGDCMRNLKNDLLDQPDVTGHEILQMCREVCNLYLFFMKNHKIAIEQNFLERFNQGVEFCASASEVLRCLVKEITVSYDMAVAGKLKEDNRPIRMAKKYIKDHYREAITLEDVSEVAGFNPTYFSSLFKKETGKNFLEFLSEVRMEQAKSLLKETNLSVAAICGEVGYSDVKYFTRSFSKYSGLKPNEYRKLYS
ncbi:response regulator [Lachnospiraceae bacterium 54-53]